MREHLIAQLICPGRHTITSLITVFGGQFEDWTQHYNLYAQARVRPQAIFDQVRREIDALRDTSEPLVLAVDDTILRKTGKQIPGAAYRRDPLGPPFNLNLVWSQRRIQFSAAVPAADGRARMIPVDFLEASTPRKPRATQSAEDWEAYRETMKQRNLNKIAADALTELQKRRAAQPESEPPGSESLSPAQPGCAQSEPAGQSGKAPPMVLLGDGSYTNGTFIKNLPEATTYIGRIRKDAKLSHLPTEQPGKGRRRVYGEDAPTPEALRRDESHPWEHLEVHVAGKLRTCRVKSLGPLRWRKTGKDHQLRLIVIAPVAYRKRKNGKRLHRRPVHLVCTDPDMPLQQIVQYYAWRWDIEVNHRDEKTLLGVGQAQVRNLNSAESVPACAVGAYSMLHLAAMKAFGWEGRPTSLPAPAWRDPKKKTRASTLDLINEIRRELWSGSIRSSHFTDFAQPDRRGTKSEKRSPSIGDAIFYSTA